MATKTVYADLIPLKAGVCRITPLDDKLMPDYSKTITTKRDFLTSSQFSTTRTSETLPNGNGSDKDYPTDEKHNLALVTQTYDPKFHRALSGDLEVASPKPYLFDTSITVPASETYEVNLTEMEPAASDDGKYHIEIRDVYRNLLEQTDAEVSEGKFKYDSDLKKLTFDASMAGQTLSCVYYRAGTNGEAYEANPVLKNTVFQLEVMGEMQSAESGKTILYYAKVPRAVVSGDIPRVMTQKSINNAITYNFSSAPVPTGMSPYYESFTPVE